MLCRAPFSAPGWGRTALPVTKVRDHVQEDIVLEPRVTLTGHWEPRAARTE
jgi:hypothetical protein